MACACSLAASGAEVHADMSHNLWWNAPEVPVLRLILTDSVASRGTVAVDVAPDIPGRCGSVKAQFDYVLARPGFRHIGACAAVLAARLLSLHS